MVLVKTSHILALVQVSLIQEEPDMFSERELRLYNSLVNAIHTSSSLHELRLNVLSGLQELVPYQSAVFFLVNSWTTGFLEPLFLGVDADMDAVYQDYYQAYVSPRMC